MINNMVIDLNDKKLNIETAAKEVMNNKKFCDELIDNLLSKNDKFRYNIFSILMKSRIKTNEHNKNCREENSLRRYRY